MATESDRVKSYSSKRFGPKDRSPAAARHLGMAYRTAWLLVQEIDNTLQQPAVSTKHGGVKRSGAAVTPVGEKVIKLYHLIEGMTSASAHQEFQSIAALVRRPRDDLLNRYPTKDVGAKPQAVRDRTAAELQVEAKVCAHAESNQRARAEALRLRIRAQC
jgi:molybdate transport repressor ModE-like protein